MPMKKGKSNEAVSYNIKEMMKNGHSQKEAIAAALASKRKYAKMAKGGLVGSEEEFDDNEDPNVAHKGHDASRSMPDMEPVSKMDAQESDSGFRSINELMMDGEYYPGEVANPQEMKESEGFAQALRKKATMQMGPENYAMGGLVELMSEAKSMYGAKPSEDMEDAAKSDMYSEPHSNGPMEHHKMGNPKGMGLSSEALEAIKQKKMKRKFGAFNPK